MDAVTRRRRLRALLAVCTLVGGGALAGCSAHPDPGVSVPYRCIDAMSRAAVARPGFADKDEALVQSAYACQDRSQWLAGATIYEGASATNVIITPQQPGQVLAEVCARVPQAPACRADSAR